MLCLLPTSFSLYAVGGSMNAWSEIVPQTTTSRQLTWLWVTLIVLGIIGLGTMLFIRHRRLTGNGSIEE